MTSSPELQFQPETYFKFIPKNLTTKGFTYKLGLNTDTKPFDSDPKTYKVGLHYTDIDNFGFFEDGKYGDYIMIVKIPVGVPVVKVFIDTYKSPSLFVESIHLYTDFLKDDTIVPEIKRNMKVPNLRMTMFQTDKEGCLKAIKNNGSVIKYIKDSPILDREICIAAINETGFAIQYIKDTPFFDREICVLAIRQTDGEAITFIKDTQFFDREMCNEVIKSDTVNNGIDLLLDLLFPEPEEEEEDWSEDEKPGE